MFPLVYKRSDGDEKTLQAGDKPLVIGRLPESEIQVHDSFISRVHCDITCSNQQFHLKDLGSANGTYRNGTRVFQCPLASGDRIQVGNTTLVFELEPANSRAILRQISSPSTPNRSAFGVTGPLPIPSQPPRLPAP